MNPHYFRGGANPQSEGSTFDYSEYERSGAIFNEREYTHILDVLQQRCKLFDSEYYDLAISPATKYSMSLLQSRIKATNTFLVTDCLGEKQKDNMRPDFIHHIIKYMRFELTILDQKLTKVRDDLQMTRVLQLRQTFYRKHLGVMQNELAKSIHRNGNNNMEKISRLLSEARSNRDCGKLELASPGNFEKSAAT